MMPTRLYFDADAEPGLSLAAPTGWGHSDQAVPRRLNRSRAGSAMVFPTLVYDVAAHLVDTDALHRRYVSPPLNGQTIIAQAVDLVVAARELSANNNLFVAWRVYLVNVSGDPVVGGELVALRRDGTEVNSTTIFSRHDSAVTAPVTAVAGHRLCVEIGVGGLPVATGTHNGQMRWGDGSANDLATSPSSSADDNPWIEFAGAITFVEVGSNAVKNDLDQKQRA
jgi:hypothetical protein